MIKHGIEIVQCKGNTSRVSKNQADQRFKKLFKFTIRFKLIWWMIACVQSSVIIRPKEPALPRHNMWERGESLASRGNLNVFP